MDTFLPGLPIPVALAAVAVIGYFFGRFQYTRTAATSDATRRELKRAQAIVLDLEKIAHRVRRELALHHCEPGGLQAPRGRAFAKRRRRRLADCCATKPSGCSSRRKTWRMQLAHAYDGIRQQSSRLMTFTGPAVRSADGPVQSPGARSRRWKTI